MSGSAGTSTTIDPGGRLMRLVRGLGVSFGRERSFRLGLRSLLADRFLVSLSSASLGPSAAERIMAICGRLLMPDGAIEVAHRMLDSARYIHLGFERDAASCIYKLYLELPEDQGGAAGPVLLHHAFKWDPQRPEHWVRTRYVWHPRLSTGQILQSIAAIYGLQGPSLEIAAQILHLAAGRMPGLMRYMEVSEENNPRRSFDLNLYDARLRLADLLPFLGRMCARYRIQPGAFYSFCEPIQAEPIGHFAGGLHRGGQDFFTVYYGVEACS
jgi:tryptophan 7-halogenase